MRASTSGGGALGGSVRSRTSAPIASALSGSSASARPTSRIAEARAAVSARVTAASARARAARACSALFSRRRARSRSPSRKRSMASCTARALGKRFTGEAAVARTQNRLELEGHVELGRARADAGVGAGLGGGEERGHGRPRVQGPPGQHLEEAGAERVDVGALVDRLAARPARGACSRGCRAPIRRWCRPRRGTTRAAARRSRRDPPAPPGGRGPSRAGTPRRRRRS